MIPELATLVRRAQHGERPAFETLVRHTARLVYAQIVSSVRDRQLAEDLTQESFVRAWKSLHALTDPAGFTTWLLTIARNVTIDAAKNRQRLKRGAGHPAAHALDRTHALEAAEEGTAGPRELAEQSEERQRVLEILEDLPDEYRRVLRMRYLGGAPYDQIQFALGLSDGALRGLLARGMALMRERLGIHAGTPAAKPHADRSGNP